MFQLPIKKRILQQYNRDIFQKNSYNYQLETEKLSQDVSLKQKRYKLHFEIAYVKQPKKKLILKK